MDVWRAVLALVEDTEDVRLARERLAGWQEKEGVSPWSDNDPDEQTP